ncbi:hypothetical protein GcM3_145015 [Golovinomyces cichoracearum]|uniref:Uncharacterized protein n=1 Tax=Golovinomyces cichoracearum TaxID=62708 RepID=A0A420HZA8_9PEZI|nr:hypothetical protein GcM3_145015 [Golovinomyces cichoracearum]
MSDQCPQRACSFPFPEIRSFISQAIHLPIKVTMRFPGYIIALVLLVYSASGIDDTSKKTITLINSSLGYNCYGTIYTREDIQIAAMKGCEKSADWGFRLRNIVPSQRLRNLIPSKPPVPSYTGKYFQINDKQNFNLKWRLPRINNKFNKMGQEGTTYVVFYLYRETLECFIRGVVFEPKNHGEEVLCRKHIFNTEAKISPQRSPKISPKISSNSPDNTLFRQTSPQGSLYDPKIPLDPVAE